MGIQPLMLKFRHQFSQHIAVLLFFCFNLTIKKVLFTLEHGMNAHKDSFGMAVLFLQTGR